ncbi:hypothetical protein Lfu02_29890 [Longispora fulva]|uniref:Glycerophosphoryl diester phosphodiesterase membrane domain-containing protein n=1 Tax=Longispora fulva TaxID=619741 RepID=A0A8J7KHX3_9ACTN|nr:hypothetical protein [Longispora fulva]MBG6139125.1 hypothetical protein [Longispora fulva]GIG58617.1 hypothetical protein Lfu02_29890 [Longispora fulva]
MASYGYQAVGQPTDDPLVPDPAAGFGGWYDRVVGVIRRSWKSLLTIAAVTIAAPTVVLSVLGSASYTQPMGDATYDSANFHPWAALLSFVVWIVSAYLGSLGAAAGVWAITQEASGRPVTLGAALRFGRTRALPVWGWQILTSILIVLGLCLCLVGSIYFAVACALVTPVVVYERSPGIPRSFKLTHARFGHTLSRLVPLALVVLALSCCLGAPGSLSSSISGDAFRFVAEVGSGLWSAVVALPIFVLVLAGTVVTYADLRSRETPLSTDQLLREAV